MLQTVAVVSSGDYLVFEPLRDIAGDNAEARTQKETAGLPEDSSCHSFHLREAQVNCRRRYPIRLIIRSPKEGGPSPGICKPLTCKQLGREEEEEVGEDILSDIQ